jgi:hypothetical protein
MISGYLIEELFAPGCRSEFSSDALCLLAVLFRGDAEGSYFAYHPIKVYSSIHALSLRLDKRA